MTPAMVLGVVTLLGAIWLVLPPGSAAALRRLGPRSGRPARWWVAWPGRTEGRGARRQRKAAAPGEAADALALIAACLDAGSTMRRALEAVAPAVGPITRDILERVSGQLTIGSSDRDAWRVLADDPCWGPVALDVSRSVASGTSLVETLRVHAAEQRRQVATSKTKEARTVGVRSVLPLMLCFLPAFVVVGVVPIIAGLLTGFF